MEIRHHELLPGGSDAQFTYYTISSIFDMNPSSTKEAADVHSFVKQSVTWFTNIQDHVMYRVWKNSKEFDLLPYTKETSNVADVHQFTFSLYSHHYENLATTLEEWLAAVHIPDYLYAPVGHYSPRMYQSRYNGFTLSIYDGSFWKKRTDKFSFTNHIPDSSQGRINDVYLVTNTETKTSDFWIKTTSGWDITTDIQITDTAPTAPSVNTIWLDPTGFRVSLSNGQSWSDEEILVRLNDLDTDAIHMQQVDSSWQFNKHNGVGWEPIVLSGNIVRDEHTWFTLDGEQRTFKILTDNSALLGVNEDEIGGGSVDVYMNTTADTSLVGTAEKLVWRDAAQVVTASTVEEDVVFVDAIDLVYATWNGTASTNGANAVIDVPTVLAHIPNFATPIAGDWHGTSQQATNQQSVTWSTPTLVGGMGDGSHVQVEVFNNNVSVAQSEVVTNNDTTTTIDGITVAVTEYQQIEGVGYGNLSVALSHTVLFSDSVRIKVVITHTDMWGRAHAYQQEYFYDRVGDILPQLDTSTTLTVSVTGTPVLKTTSGFNSYTTGTNTALTVNNMRFISRDTTKVGTNFVFDSTLPIETIQASTIVDTGLFSGIQVGQNDELLQYNDNKQFDVDGVVTASQVVANITLSDPWSDNEGSLISSSKLLVDTLVDSSTDLYEDFSTESRRLSADQTTAWNSTAQLVAGNAAVFQGKLYVPSNLRSPQGLQLGDLTTYLPINTTSTISQPVEYHRAFTLTPNNDFSSLVFEIEGTFGTYNDINDALANDAVKIFVYKGGAAIGTTGKINANTDPLWLHGAKQYSYVTFNNGSTQSNEGATIRTSHAGTASEPNSRVQATFGAYKINTSLWMQLVLADDSIIIDSIRIIE